MGDLLKTIVECIFLLVTIVTASIVGLGLIVIIVSAILQIVTGVDILRTYVHPLFGG